MTSADSAPFTAVILAASRRGPDDPVARIQGLSHKCLVTLNGTPMIERVIRAHLDAPEIGRVFVSIEDPAILDRVPALKALREAGEIACVASKGNLAESVFAAIDAIEAPFPLIISTADNALHTPELLSHFCAEIAATEGDAFVAITPAQLILDKYPEGQRAFHRLKDAAWSSCNLYAVTGPEGARAARAFATGGQFGKKPRRILKAFGLVPLILYKLRLVTLDGVFRSISRSMRITARPVIIPWAEGPIDVDNPKDFALVESILKTREGAA